MSKKTSYFLNHLATMNSLNLESGDELASLPAETGGNAAAAAAIVARMNTPTKVKELLSFNMESAALDTGLRNSNLLTTGMLQRPDIIKYNAESYANQGNEPYRGMTADFNFGAATQDEFGEAFYRTVVIDSAEGYLKLKVSIPLVYDMYQHSEGAGKEYADLYKSIIHAYVDDSILAQTVTSLIPNSDTAANAALFVPAALAGNKTATVDGISYNTRPLVVGKAIDLLTVSTPTGVVNKFDGSDTLAGLEVSELVYKVGATASGLRLDITSASAAGFIPAVGGNETTYQLQNLPIVFKLTDESELDSGVLLNTLAGFDFLGTTVGSVTFAQRLGGTSNFQTGSVTVNPLESEVRILKVLDTDGDEILSTDATYTAVVDALKTLALAGFTPKSTATNLNRRKQGRLLDIVEVTRNIPVIFGQPMSIIAPTLNASYGEDQFRSIENLTKVQRVVNSNNAVKQILADYNTFSALHGAELNMDDSSLPGIAQFSMRPWAEQAEVDVSLVTQAQDSASIRDNIQAVLTNILMSQVTRAYQESRYVAAKSWYVPHDFKPTVTVGTDALIINYLQTAGDPRTLGPNFNVKLVATANDRMKGLIIWSFNADDIAEPNSVHPLESGNFIWSPELVGTATINRGGATNVEAIVVPRTRHFKNTPIIGVIRVVGLDKALGEKLPFTIGGKLTLLDANGDAVTPAAPVGP